MTLGELIKSSRKGRGLRANALIKEAGLEITPPQLSYWEADKRLPKPQELEKISEYLGIPLKLSFSLWVQAHMPTEKLKQLFSKDTPEAERLGTAVREAAGDIKFYPAPVTITLQSRDADWFNKNPEAMTFLSRALHWTLRKEQSSIDRFRDDMDLSKSETKSILKKLVELGYLVEAEPGQFQTPPGMKYIYPPNTKEFEPMRKARMKYVYGKVIDNLSPRDLSESVGFRQILGKPLTEDQAKKITDKLEALFLELLHEEGDPQGKRYWFVGAFGAEPS